MFAAVLHLQKGFFPNSYILLSMLSFQDAFGILGNIYFEKIV